MTTRSLPIQVAGPVGWLAASFAAGAIGAMATRNAPTFYAQLSRPSWAPPASVFAPVWSTLFVLMGIAAWLVWRSPGPRRTALGLFGVQLVFNALWSWLFFAWHSGAGAMAEILMLLALIVATGLAFWRIHRVAGLLLVPYVLWVSFASLLTWTLWRSNPGLL